MRLRFQTLKEFENQASALNFANAFGVISHSKNVVDQGRCSGLRLANAFGVWFRILLQKSLGSRVNRISNCGFRIAKLQAITPEAFPSVRGRSRDYPRRSL